MRPSVGELIGMFLIGFVYMGSFVIFLFMAIAAWDKFKDVLRRRRGSGLL